MTRCQLFLALWRPIGFEYTVAFAVEYLAAVTLVAGDTTCLCHDKHRNYVTGANSHETYQNCIARQAH